MVHVDGQLWSAKAWSNNSFSPTNDANVAAGSGWRASWIIAVPSCWFHHFRQHWLSMGRGSKLLTEKKNNQCWWIIDETNEKRYQLSIIYPSMDKQQLLMDKWWWIVYTFFSPVQEFFPGRWDPNQASNQDKQGRWILPGISTRST